MAKISVVILCAGMSTRMGEDKTFLEFNGKKAIELILKKAKKCKIADIIIVAGKNKQKVKEITNGVGVPVVYDGVGKNTLEGSLECLSIRGMFVSFGNASGPLDLVNVAKSIQPKGLYLTRPSIMQYTTTREELEEATNKVFEMVSSGKVKIKISKKY